METKDYRYFFTFIYLIIKSNNKNFVYNNLHDIFNIWYHYNFPAEIMNIEKEDKKIKLNLRGLNMSVYKIANEEKELIMKYVNHTQYVHKDIDDLSELQFESNLNGELLSFRMYQEKKIYFFEIYKVKNTEYIKTYPSFLGKNKEDDLFREIGEFRIDNSNNSYIKIITMPFPKYEEWKEINRILSLPVKEIVSGYRNLTPAGSDDYKGNKSDILEILDDNDNGDIIIFKLHDAKTLLTFINQNMEKILKRVIIFLPIYHFMK